MIGIETNADAAAKTYAIQGLSGYSYEDLKLEDFKQTVDGISCTYLLRDKTGLRTYFNEDGVVVLQKTPMTMPLPIHTPMPFIWQPLPIPSDERLYSITRERVMTKC